MLTLTTIDGATHNMRPVGLMYETACGMRYNGPGHVDRFRHVMNTSEIRHYESMTWGDDPVTCVRCIKLGDAL